MAPPRPPAAAPVYGMIYPSTTVAMCVCSLPGWRYPSPSNIYTFLSFCRPIFFCTHLFVGSRRVFSRNSEFRIPNSEFPRYSPFAALWNLSRPGGDAGASSRPFFAGILMANRFIIRVLPSLLIEVLRCCFPRPGRMPLSHPAGRFFLPMPGNEPGCAS